MSILRRSPSRASASRVKSRPTIFRAKEVRLASPHVRKPGEYTRPGRTERVVTWEQAKSISKDDERSLDEVPYYWVGLRGSQENWVASRPYHPDIVHELWGELVPEPRNRHDPTALAVDLDAVRAGYVSARAAAHMHWRVREMNVRGFAVEVPLELEVTDGVVGAFVALPTFHTWDERFLEDHVAQARRLLPIWEELPPDAWEQIIRDAFHLQPWTLEAVVNTAASLGITGVGFPVHPVPEATPRSINILMYNLRRRNTAKVREERRIERLKAHAVQDARVIELLATGMTQRAAAEELGVSTASISASIRRHNEARTAALAEARKEAQGDSASTATAPC